MSDASVDAGSFGAWLSGFRASLKGRQGTEVPCGDCVGCCVSSYSILIRLEDAPARAAIPPEFQTEAPALGPGVRAMGYLPDGTCPMLRSGRCSIYSLRPQTCRDYDCRVFAAAGIEAGPGKDVINRRVLAWRFKYESEAERAAHRAVRTAAAFIREQGERLSDKRLPKNPSGIAVLAVKCFSMFLDPAVLQREPREIAAAVLQRGREFDVSENSLELLSD